MANEVRLKPPLDKWVSCHDAIDRSIENMYFLRDAMPMTHCVRDLRRLLADGRNILHRYPNPIAWRSMETTTEENLTFLECERNRTELVMQISVRNRICLENIKVNWLTRWEVKRNAADDSDQSLSLFPVHSATHSWIFKRVLFTWWKVKVLQRIRWISICHVDGNGI